jgi:hypothetical protein
MTLSRLMLALLAAVLISAGCSCGGVEYTLYTDEAGGFAISHPNDWEQVPQEEVPEGILVIFRPAVTCGNVTESINVVKAGLPAPMTVDEWFADKQVPLTSLGEYTPISTEKVTVNGVDAIKHVYTAIGAPSTIVQAMQLYLLDGMTAWVVTCRCDPACYAGYEAMFNTVVNSFRVLD